MGSQVDPPSLLVFTTSQIALPRRYPHPHKPNLIVPPLIHRALHSAFDPDPPRVSVSGSTIIIPDPESIVKHDLPLTLANNGNAPAQESSATGQAGVEAAALDSSQPPTSSDRPDGLEKSDITDAEITVKLHLVGPSKGPSSDSASSTSPSQISERRLRWIVQALEALRRYKGLVEIDTLLLGFKGIDYKGKKTVASEFFGCGAEGLEEGTGAENVDEETAQGVLDVWRTVTAAKESQAGSSKQRSHHHGSTSEVSSRSQANGHASNTHFASTDGLADTMSRVQSLGTLYLPLSLLEILSETASPPAINSMDTPDCHHLPKEYSSFARSKGIELWAGGGGEGSDPLPATELHNLFQEFNSSIQPIVEKIPGGHRPDLLAALIPVREDGLKYVVDARPDMCVDWVLGYTLVSKTRNVVKDKGYIVSAHICS